jgi:hypothetical protein
MRAHDIVVRALECIGAQGFVSKQTAMTCGGDATSVLVARSLDVAPVTDDDRATYGDEATRIIDWISTAPSSDEFLTKCREAVAQADAGHAGVYGYLCALPSAYHHHIAFAASLDKISSPNQYVADPGTYITSLLGEVINVQLFHGYYKVKLVDDVGRLVSYTVNTDSKKGAPSPRVGDTLSVTGTVGKLKFDTPTETVMTRVKVAIAKA